MIKMKLQSMLVLSVVFPVGSVTMMAEASEMGGEVEVNHSNGLRVPRVSKPWSEALRLVGDSDTHYADFALIKDKLDRWHCIGTYGAGPDGESDGGITLFHAVGDSLDAPMALLEKIPHQLDSLRQAMMWAPGAIWNRESTKAFLYYFHAVNAG